MQHGTYTSCDTKIQQVTPIVDDKNKLENWQIISKLANNFADVFNYNSQQEIFNEIQLVNRIYHNCEIDDYWNKNAKNQEILQTIKTKDYLLYEIDTSTFEPEKPSIHYSDSFFRKKIKARL